MPKPLFFHNRLTRRLDVLVRQRLWLQVMIALVLGAVVGILLGPNLALLSRPASDLIGEWLALPGRLFLAVVRMVIVPLAVSSIILGIAGSGGGEALKAMGQRFTFFVLSTTLAATVMGVTIGRLIRPGAHMTAPLAPQPVIKPDVDLLPVGPSSPLEVITRDLPQLITNLIPQNITASLLDQDMLAIVVFSLFIGIAVVKAHNKELTTPLVALTQAVLEVCMTVLRDAMRFAPVAVFGLIAETTAANGVQTLIDLAVYCFVVLSGLLALLLLYLAIIVALGKMKPLTFLKAVAPVQLLAFSTSSSAAVMPLTMKTAVDKLGVPPASAGAIVPLASTVNMAGTALYQAAAIMFLADSAGVPLSLGDLALIMVTLTGASIGAPAAPGASIAILSTTAAGFGVPLSGLSLIVGVDRILDMARTAVNVTGDLVACRILSSGPAAVEAVPAAPPPEGEPLSLS